MIVDDHGNVLNSLRTLLEIGGDSEVVGAAMSGGQAIAKARELKPDVIVMDFAMDDMDGVEAGSKIREELPETEVIILSVYDEAEYHDRASRAGIRRWVSKNASPESLLEAVSAAGGGRSGD